MNTLVLACAILLTVICVSLSAADASVLPPATDWLVNPATFKSDVRFDAARHELTIENGLARRVFRLAPNAATVDYRNLVTGEQILRATGPEAKVTIDGTLYNVGGLEGQPVQNYLKAEWLDQLREGSNPPAYRFAEWKEEPLAARFPWKKRAEWLARDYPWPAPGKQVVLRFVASDAMKAKAEVPEIDVHYAIYDGIPLIEKWLTIRNTAGKTVRVNKTIVETLKVVESESSVEPNTAWEPPSLYIETDYTYCAMNGKGANQFTVRWLTDKSYGTQVSYELQTPCLVEVAPQFGPETDLAAGAQLTSIRAFELLRDGTDRERRGLAQRKMYRVIAPWTQENPVMVHLVSNNPETIRKIIDQAAEVGVEMIILSFGSGMNMENADAKYQAKYKEVADYAASKGIAIGAYSLLGSRGAATPADNCGGPGARVRFGTMPCLGSTWGKWYLSQLQSFLTNTGFGILEHDGSYPADTCGHTDHPGHRDLGDSQWVQWTAITNFYKWCRANGVYLNVPDWYFLNGSSKTGMGYRETNWSLPRNEQEIIERQNVFDGTWDKTSSMGWMFVPLTQYHGGGAAATIEPLSEHLDHYEARLSNLFGAGVQACYRGPRIYDTDATKAVVKKWIAFYKQHRDVLDADMIHLRRPDGRDWDGFVHVNPQGKEKALAFFYNPLPEAIEREIRLPLHYAGLTEKAKVSIEGVAPETVTLDRAEAVTVKVKIPARGRTWVVVTE
ncbi:MAG TPA: alpha-galactosidase [Planctomycetota bacterium]